MDIEKNLLLDYLNYIDLNFNDEFDTILVTTDIGVTNFQEIVVKYLPSYSNYATQSKSTYLTVGKEQHFENDSIISVRMFLVKNQKLESKRNSKNNISFQKTPFFSSKNLNKDYYIRFDQETKKWIIDKSFELRFPYYGEYGIVLDSTSVRQFIEALKVTPALTNYVNSITTEGQVSYKWLSIEDLELLISLINSKEPANCIVRSISSQRYDSHDTSTIGDQVAHILYCYMNKLPYPDRLNICPADNEEKKHIILRWWNEQNK